MSENTSEPLCHAGNIDKTGASLPFVRLECVSYDTRFPLAPKLFFSYTSFNPPTTSYSYFLLLLRLLRLLFTLTLDFFFYDDFRALYGLCVTRISVFTGVVNVR